jgi:hypothetical protein
VPRAGCTGPSGLTVNSQPQEDDDDGPGGLATNECAVCFERYTSDADSARLPRILKCGHTFCQHCITMQLTKTLAQGNSKPYSCPECRTITHVPRGQAARLTKNHGVMV